MSNQRLRNISRLVFVLALLAFSTKSARAMPDQCEEICGASESCGLECGVGWTMITCNDYGEGWAALPDAECDISTWDSCSYICPNQGSTEACYNNGDSMDCNEYGVYLSCGDNDCAVSGGENYDTCGADCSDALTLDPPDDGSDLDEMEELIDDVNGLISAGGNSPADLSDVWHVMYQHGQVDEDTADLSFMDEDELVERCGSACMQFVIVRNCETVKLRRQAMAKAHNISKGFAYIMGAAKMIAEYVGQPIKSAKFTGGLAVAATMLALTFDYDDALGRTSCQ